MKKNSDNNNNHNNNNGRLNNEQRKALAKIIQESFSKKIEQARDRNGELVKQITNTLKEELGYSTIDNQVKALEAQIEMLKKKQEQIGFCKYNSDNLLPGSEAKKLLDQRVQAENQDVISLEKELNNRLVKVWTASEIEEVTGFFEDL